MPTVNFNFYQVTAKIRSNSPELLNLLTKDFSFFLSSPTSSAYQIESTLGEIPWKQIEGLTSAKQSINSITIDKKNIRYNNYYNKALSIYNFHTNTAQIYSEDINLLHEISYLLILSRTGKRLDLIGLHKIHAFGVTYKKTALIGMMPMKGGKTSLFLDLLQHPDMEIISDDTPIITSTGKILPFPLRIGVIDKIPPGNPDLIYQINRQLYGPKTLLSINYFSNKISSAPPSQIILFNGIRKFDQNCTIVQVSTLKMILPLIKNMVVGIGLPTIIEYFLESSLTDFFRNIHILTRRLIAASCLLFRAKKYFIYLGTDRASNSKKIYNFLKNLNH